MEQRFEALNRICLNNWHYIDRKILSFNSGINFFTGHSGSGKSTVIDALQILLYANTDGRSFFNKAATDDSDRTLMEYLRGMVSIGENNEYTYLRNKNFSTTIAIELMRTDTGERQCIGVVFDVNTAVNENSKTFFWHRGAIPENGYRMSDRPMCIEELKNYIRQELLPEQYYFESTNERFRSKLYDVYLGGLNHDRFPKLFKRAIPFKMNMKLSDFLKEYICMEQEINIESMQESVAQYSRMCRQIKDIQNEVNELEEIQKVYDGYTEKKIEEFKTKYFEESLEILEQKDLEEEIRLRIIHHKEAVKLQEKAQKELKEKAQQLAGQKEELERLIAATGYEELEEALQSVNQLIENYSVSRGKWEKVSMALSEWEDQSVTPNQVLWDIEEFQKKTITCDGIKKLKSELNEIRCDIKKQKDEADAALRKMASESKQINSDLDIIKRGETGYPKYLRDARKIIQNELQKKAGRQIKVDILADLIEVRDEKWRDAVEGYMAGNKLLLIVQPEYAKAAMEIYRNLDSKEYHRAAVLDTEKVSEGDWQVKRGALAEEVTAKLDYVRSYVQFLMGNVIKCESIDELREHKTGITSTCELYSGFKFKHINPEHYTKYAYIGEMSRRQRIRTLEAQLEEIKEQMKPQLEISREAGSILSLEYLSYDETQYTEWLDNISKIKAQESKRKTLEDKIKAIKEKNIDDWKEKLAQLKTREDSLRLQIEEIIKQISKMEESIRIDNERHTDLEEKLKNLNLSFNVNEDWDKEVQEYLNVKKHNNSAVIYSELREEYQKKHVNACKAAAASLSLVRNMRVEYLKKRPNRTFDSENCENNEFAGLLEKLRYSDLDGLYKKAAEQAGEAVFIFKHDFIYKIRSAIKAAMEQKNQLNRIIGRMDFGKDRYSFIIEKSKGADGRFYPLFMNDDLEINPSMLKNHMENQMDMFTMSHEEQYGDLMMELLEIFIPPENATAQELDEAKKNMHKYADYRTYLFFDMQQAVSNENREINIRLGNMIKKNSGGEGQNPQYVALLASFLQAYRIDLSPKLQRNPTIRLVILDEAFSKMDAEKVAGCISLMRKFGLQAIISSTNDKIQSYLDSVDKTLLFANPDKKHISVLEFERKDFDRLRSELEEERE